MNLIKETLTRRRELWIIGIAFFAVYILNIGSLRFVRDDWSNLAHLNGMCESYGFIRTLWKITNNEWLASRHIPRVFFMAWWIQFLELNIFGFNHVPYYIFILSIHFINSVLVYYIVLKITRNNCLSLVVSLFFLTSPTSTNVLFWLNNWFFSMPVFFFLLYITLYLNRMKNTFMDYLFLALVFVLCQFSGEQIIPVLYTFAAISIFIGLRSFREERDRKGILRSLIPPLIGLAALVIYMKFVIVTEPVMGQVGISTGRVLAYLKDFAVKIFRFYNVAGQPYGFCTIGPSVTTYLLAAFVSIFIALSVFKTRASKLPAAPGIVAPLAVSAMVILMASTVSPLYGAATGFRLDVEPRYICIPGLIIAITLPLILWMITGGTVAFKFISWLLISYFSFLTIYSLNDIWGIQKEIDNRIWRQVDSRLNQNIKAIVTDNGIPDRLGLTPHFHSDAISDFQASWGITFRIMVKHGQKVNIAKSAELLENGKLRLLWYHGEEAEFDDGEVMFLVYRYGEKFSDLLDDRLYIFTDYDDYIESK